MSYDHMVPDGKGGYHVYHHSSLDDYSTEETLASKVGTWLLCSLVITVIVAFGFLAYSQLFPDKEMFQYRRECNEQWDKLSVQQREDFILQYRSTVSSLPPRQVQISTQQPTLGVDSESSAYYQNTCATAKKEAAEKLKK